MTGFARPGRLRVMETTASAYADVMVRLSAERAGYAALRPRVEAGAPWPLAERFGTEPESSWGPREVLAHLGEMLPYWLGEYERIVEAGRSPGDGVPFGRIADDPMRIGILERDRTVPLRELFARVDAGIARWERRLSEAVPGEGEFVGQHPRRGDVTAAGLVDTMVVQHLEEHREQLEGIVAAR
jgi:hypothetical protein